MKVLVNNKKKRKVHKKPPLKAKKPQAKTLNLQKEMVESLKKRGKNKAEEDVVSKHLDLIQMIAANIVGSGKAPPGFSFQDLVSFGTEGIIKAWESFDAGRGIQFRVYASYRVRGEILDRIRKEWKYRNPSSYKSVQGKIAQAALDSSDSQKSDEENLKDVVGGSAVAFLLSTDEGGKEVVSNIEGMMDPADSVVDQIELSRERRLLWNEVKNLADDEKQIITMFYIEDKTQKEIAKAMGYSKSKISRMHADILKRLKLRLKRAL